MAYFCPRRFVLQAGKGMLRSDFSCRNRRVCSATWPGKGYLGFTLSITGGHCGAHICKQSQSKPAYDSAHANNFYSRSSARMPRSEERGGMAARSVAEEQNSSWFKKPHPKGRGSLLQLFADCPGSLTETRMLSYGERERN